MAPDRFAAASSLPSAALPSVSALSNFALQAKSRDEFVHLLTDDLPERPGYFAQDAEIIVPVPRRWRIFRAAGAGCEGSAERCEAGALVLDTRPAGQFGGDTSARHPHLA